MEGRMKGWDGCQVAGEVQSDGGAEASQSSHRVFRKFGWSGSSSDGEELIPNGGGGTG